MLHTVRSLNWPTLYSRQMLFRGEGACMVLYCKAVGYMICCTLLVGEGESYLRTQDFRPRYSFTCFLKILSPDGTCTKKSDNSKVFFHKALGMPPQLIYETPFFKQSLTQKTVSQLKMKPTYLSIKNCLKRSILLSVIRGFTF